KRMLLLLTCLVVFAAIVSLVLALAWKDASPMEARMAMLRGERPVTTYEMATRQESVGSRVLLPLANSLGGKLEVMLPTKWVHGVERQLVRAGEPISLTGFLAASAICSGMM